MANRAVNGYVKTDVDGIYNDALKSIKQAYNDIVKINNYKAQVLKTQTMKQYDDKRNDTYVNARVSAIGDNETLAAAGLASGLNQAPKSGVSETARIAKDNTLRNNLNALNAQEAADLNDISIEALIAGFEADADFANEAADIYLKQAQDKIDENRYASEFELDNFGAYLDAVEVQSKTGLNALSSKTGAQAAQEIKTYGKVKTKETAQLLGVPVGTSAADVVYRLISIGTI